MSEEIAEIQELIETCEDEAQLEELYAQLDMLYMQQEAQGE